MPGGRCSAPRQVRSWRMATLIDGLGKQGGPRHVLHLVLGDLMTVYSCSLDLISSAASWQTLLMLVNLHCSRGRYKRTMASQDARTTVLSQFTLNHNAQQQCRHCGIAMSASCQTTLKRHLAWCKSLPDSVRDVMDQAAVCESRAGIGRYGGAHALVYRGFRVTGWGVNECWRCGKVIRGWVSTLKQHSERGCDGVAVTWATVDVCGQFETMDGCADGERSKCRHCGSAVQLRQRRPHLAVCKSLPDSV